MSETIGGRYAPLGPGWPGRLGMWHQLSTPDGRVCGGLRFDHLGPANADASWRVARVNRELAAMRLPGLVNVIDQMVDRDQVWLITDVAPIPTVAELLAAGGAMPAEVARLVAMDTAETLERLHGAGQAHGDIGPHNVVLTATGTVLLAETGLAHALSGTAAGPGLDTAAWALMVADLANAASDPSIAHLLRQAARHAEPMGGGAGLAAALATLRAAGFADRAPVRALHASALTVATSQATVPVTGVAGGEVGTVVLGEPQHDETRTVALGSPGVDSGATVYVDPGDDGSRTVMLTEPRRDAPGTVLFADRESTSQTMSATGPAAARDGGTRFDLLEPKRTQAVSSLGNSFGVGPTKTPAKLREKRPWGRRVTRVLSGVVTLVLVAGAVWIGWQWWQKWQNDVTVGSVAVAPAALPGTKCDTQVDIVGTINTNGKAGTITYQWVRSDGQSSGVLSQSMASGQKSTRVHLYWRFSGKGTMAATATLDVLSPTKIDGATTFTYACK